MSDFWPKVDKTLRYHAAQMRRTTRLLLWAARRPIAHNPVFVVGCSRAGTTLVYKTLSEAEELGSIHCETHDFWASLHPLEERGWQSHALTEAEASARDRETVSRYFYINSASTRFVDKNNQNGLCVQYLYSLFPDAHFVYVKRSPGDNIHSLIEGWKRPEEFATWSSDLPAEVAIDGGRFTRWCFFLPDGWREYLHANIEDVCAFQYLSINRAILEAAERIPSVNWTEVLYEDLVRDPVEGFEHLFRSIGVGFTKNIEKHCAAVLDNPYNAFSTIKLNKWEEGVNRERIDHVLPTVSSLAQAMGY